MNFIHNIQIFQIRLFPLISPMYSYENNSRCMTSLKRVFCILAEFSNNFPQRESYKDILNINWISLKLVIDTFFYFFSGLGFRPMPPESNVESTLIWYKGSDPNNYKYWTEEIDKFLKRMY